MTSNGLRAIENAGCNASVRDLPAQRKSIIMAGLSDLQTGGHENHAVRRLLIVSACSFQSEDRNLIHLINSIEMCCQVTGMMPSVSW